MFFFFQILNIKVKNGYNSYEHFKGYPTAKSEGNKRLNPLTAGAVHIGFYIFY